MKRCWFGLGLLIILLILSIAVTVYMESIYQPLSDTAAGAAAQALAGDWEGAVQLLRQTRHDWQRHWKSSAAFADHAPMENINALFAQLEVSAALRDEADFAALCAHLSAELDAMGEAHGFTWWNLL